MTDAAVWAARDVARTLRRPVATDDKYSRGVVGLRTGSERYPGAAVLGVEAAWRAGAGMVRYLGPSRAQALVLQRRPETVLADGRVQAWVVGSGTDAAESAELIGILDGDVPVVVDAGALERGVGARAPRIFTPHDREHDRLRAAIGLPPTLERVSAALQTARELNAVVLLKGAVTIAAAPDGWHARIESRVPWLATAGSGDVLAGIVGALVAGGGAPLERLSASAAWIHGRAGALAVADVNGGPITALDVAAAVPRVIGELLTHAPNPAAT